jgi:peptide-methionine (S)-S-oxide reductase
MSYQLRIALFAVVAVSVAALPAAVAVRNSKRIAVPPPALVEAAKGNREVAILAGGCFWGVEAVFEHVKGVSEVTSGFAGRQAAGANYEKVSTGTTGNAEAVRIVFDPRKIGYAELLRIFFSVAHDPTQVNRQGPDVGTQYRSAIFPQSPAQAKIAKAYIAQLQKSHAFKQPIATRIETGRFMPAEAYHQDFMRKNPTYPYIVINDRPKLAALKQQFPSYWKA